MAVMFTVHADSEGEARAELARLCAALGMVPAGRVMQLPGRPRWMARARKTPRAESPIPDATAPTSR